MGADLRLWWRHRGSCQPFRTGVSLHSHTLHSREYLSFIPHYLERLPLVARLVRREARRYGLKDLPREDFARAWWTPPLSPRDAWTLERSQIEDRLQKLALVSITDHDNIAASAELRAFSALADTPVSLEWTVPYSGSFFHFGMHNLPPHAAPLVAEMNRYTENGREELLCDILRTVFESDGTLIVLNHPLWDVEMVGRDAHLFALGCLMGRLARSVHALEFNADRPWDENRACVALADRLGLPVVGGGDRHGCHASPVLNLTSADTFGGFAEEIRAGRSAIALLPRIRESYKLRLVETALDILRDYPDHSRGWVRWCDRVFYTRPDDAVVSLSDLWGSRQPGVTRGLVNLVSLLRTQTFRPALRWALAEKEAAW